MTKTLSREVWRGALPFSSRKTPLARAVLRFTWLFKTHLTPSYRFVLCTRCYSCVLLRGTKFEGNRSSPLYAICLNWITFLQCVGFDSKLFYGRHCQIEPDGEHPTSRERFILPIKPSRSREFNPFHRKHHKASNASSEWLSNKTAFS